MARAGHLLLAALLSIQLQVDLGPLVNRVLPAHSRESCGGRFIGYRFVGQPHQAFEYMGETYEIGDYGYVELIADNGPRGMKYKVDGEVVPLRRAPIGPFGLVEVKLRAR
jgi:UDP-N-acetylglucosamine enolpyruvyl transferase